MFSTSVGLGTALYLFLYIPKSSMDMDALLMIDRWLDSFAGSSGDQGPTQTADRLKVWQL